jgi:hypothetical protein
MQSHIFSPQLMWFYRMRKLWFTYGALCSILVTLGMDHIIVYFSLSTLFEMFKLFLSFLLRFLPLPSIAGFYLARFFTKKSLPSYFSFVVLGSLMVTWFVMRNFWDLNIWLAGMSLKSFCKLIIANFVLAMAVPGLAILPSKLHFLTDVGLISHALLLCHIENRFFNYSSIYYYGFEDEVMYPSYMVILTTLLGLALVRRMSVDHRIGQKAVWILTCLYSSKLAMPKGSLDFHKLNSTYQIRFNNTIILAHGV